MPLRSVYIRKEDLEAWEALEKKSETISAMLNGGLKLRLPTSKKPSPSRGLVKVAKETQKVDKRNPDIQLIVDTWDKVLGMPDGTQAENRRYAKLLIDKRGLERAAGAITAFQAIKGKKYSPKITGLKSLYYKWGDLEDYYLRKKADDEDPERELTQDELNKEFGL